MLSSSFRSIALTNGCPAHELAESDTSPSCMSKEEWELLSPVAPPTTLALPVLWNESYHKKTQITNNNAKKNKIDAIANK